MIGFCLYWVDRLLLVANIRVSTLNAKAVKPIFCMLKSLTL